MENLNIACSLNDGKILNKKSLLFLTIFVGIYLIAFLAFGLVLCIGFQDLLNIDKNIVIALIFVTIIVGIFDAVLLVITVKQWKIKKKVDTILEDSVQVKAYASEIGRYYAWWGANSVRIQVKFKIDGKKYQIDSALDKSGGIKGNFKKYVNKEIDILFSPQYREVLILQ